MNPITLETSIAEAKRFLDKAEPLLAIWQKSPPNKYWPTQNGKLRGFVKRSSMDLTRALADLRRPN